MVIEYYIGAWNRAKLCGNNNLDGKYGKVMISVSVKELQTNVVHTSNDMKDCDESRSKPFSEKDSH